MELLAPFQSPVSVFGSIMLFFCLLLMSNYWYPGNRYNDQAWWNYSWRNAVFLVAAGTAIAVGQMHGMMGMANTGTTFLVLWVMEKYCELHCERDWNGWVGMLLGSISLYAIAMWLHAHPAFIVSLFASA